MKILFLASETTDFDWTIPLFFLPFFVAAVYGLYITIRYYYWYNIKPIESHYKIILGKYFTYYNNLTPKLKGVFERRVSLFIRAKDYYGQEGLKITDEMKVLIAATAVQITFGFKFFQLPRFHKIFVYPHAYYSPQTKKKHKGEVHPLSRAIKLSWDNFLNGLQDPADGINLGLHEMTHAMSLENRFTSNGVYGFISPKTFYKWKVIAQKEMQLIKKGGKSIFRSYASTNIEEFLAVSVEVFFEQPNEFANYNSPLFKETCNLLNQYPI